MTDDPKPLTPEECADLRELIGPFLNANATGREVGRLLATIDARDQTIATERKIRADLADQYQRRLDGLAQTADDWMSRAFRAERERDELRAEVERLEHARRAAWGEVDTLKQTIADQATRNNKHMFEARRAERQCEELRSEVETLRAEVDGWIEESDRWRTHALNNLNAYHKVKQERDEARAEEERVRLEQPSCTACDGTGEDCYSCDGTGLAVAQLVNELESSKQMHQAAVMDWGEACERLLKAEAEIQRLLDILENNDICPQCGDEMNYGLGPIRCYGKECT